MRIRRSNLPVIRSLVPRLPRATITRRVLMYFLLSRFCSPHLRLVIKRAGEEVIEKEVIVPSAISDLFRGASVSR